jgi:hypothetical protein
MSFGLYNKWSKDAADDDAHDTFAKKAGDPKVYYLVVISKFLVNDA